MIYLWLFSDVFEYRMYTGHTMVGIQGRTLSHVGKIVGLSRGGVTDSEAPQGLYQEILVRGFGKVLVLPLQVCPDSYTLQQMLEVEQQWINHFDTKRHGFNKVNAKAGQPLGLGYWGAHRRYGYRDMTRRLHACSRSIQQGQFNAQTYFGTFGTGVLLKMLSCLRDHTTDVVLEDAHFDAIQTALVATINARRDAPLPAAQRAERKLLVSSYWTPFIDMINLPQVLQLPHVTALLPQGVGVPLIGHKYSHPLHLKWCSHRRLARTLTDQDIQQVLSSPCRCNDPRCSDLKEGGLPCVFTCKDKAFKVLLQDMGGYPVHVDFTGFFLLGAMQRPTPSQVCIMAPHIAAGLKEGMHQSLHTFQVQQGQADPQHVPALQQWALAVKQEVDTRIGSIPLGHTITYADRKIRPGTPFLMYRSGFDNLIRVLHQSYVVTIADKLSKNFVIICRKYYVQQCLQDLANPHFYSPQAQHGLTVDTVETHLRQQTQNRVPGVPLPAAHKNAIYQALGKMHTVPPKMRFLVASHATVLRSHGMWLTALFRGMTPSLSDLWREELRKVDQYISPYQVPMWVLKNSADFVKGLKWFNRCGVTPQDFQAKGRVSTADVERLYTHINLPDLKAVLHQVFDLVWEVVLATTQFQVPGGANVDDVCFKVYKSKHRKVAYFATIADARLSVGAQNPHHTMQTTNQGRDKFGLFYLFTKADARAMFDLLVDNTYIQFGASLWYQICGIPMGISPAVFIANMYLWYSEFQFLSRLVTVMQQTPPLPGGETLAARILDDPQPPIPAFAPYKGGVALLLLQSYRFTYRFVDDLLFAINPYFKRLLFVDQYVAGQWFQGIYPRFFNIVVEDMQEHSLPFLDVLCKFEVEDTYGRRFRVNPEGQLQPTGEAGSVVVVRTHLYDKRRQDCYADIPIVQYTHITSNLSTSCVYNILVSQLHRFMQIITDVHNYSKEVGICIGKLMHNGYCLRPLMQKLRAFQHTHVQAFPDLAEHKIILNVRRELRGQGLI